MVRRCANIRRPGGAAAVPRSHKVRAEIDAGAGRDVVLKRYGTF
jgi:hypothetical protein